MRIQYLNEEIRRAATTAGPLPAGWTSEEVARLRLVVQCLHASKVREDVISLRSLRLHSTLSGSTDIAALLSVDRTLTLAFKTDNSPISAMIDVVLVRTDDSR